MLRLIRAGMTSHAPLPEVLPPLLQPAIQQPTRRNAPSERGGASIHQHIGLADAGRIADLLHAKIGDVGTRNDAVAPL